jgi:restriction system protein
MPVPDFQSMMLPYLQFLADGKEHLFADSITYIADHFKLSEQDRKETLPSGNQARLNNRVGWCRTHLKNALLIEYVRRGVIKISERGKQFLAQKPTALNLKILDQIPEHKAWFHQKKSEEGPLESTQSEGVTPEEQMELLAADLKQKLSLELLEGVKAMDPFRFQKLVLDVLFAMGYGGSRVDAIQETKKSNDEGIDGWINEDRLGLNRIYIQAKRWAETPVGRPALQSFAGALIDKGQRSKGVFITASSFTSQAKEYAENQQIVLIDGRQLAELMIEHNIGVSLANNYEIKRVDSDYFEEE